MAKGRVAVGREDITGQGHGIRTGHLIVHTCNRQADDGEDIKGAPGLRL